VFLNITSGCGQSNAWLINIYQRIDQMKLEVCGGGGDRSGFVANDEFNFLRKRMKKRQIEQIIRV
jgi:hypothetical protein